MKFWAIEHHWADDDAVGYQTTLYDSEEKARASFNALVKSAKEDSWGGVIDEDGTVSDEYVLEETENSFKIFEEGFYNDNHEDFNLVQLDVN